MFLNWAEGRVHLEGGVVKLWVWGGGGVEVRGDSVTGVWGNTTGYKHFGFRNTVVLKFSYLLLDADGRRWLSAVKRRRWKHFRVTQTQRLLQTKERSLVFWLRVSQASRRSCEHQAWTVDKTSGWGSGAIEKNKSRTVPELRVWQHLVGRRGLYLENKTDSPWKLHCLNHYWLDHHLHLELASCRDVGFSLE